MNFLFFNIIYSNNSNTDLLSGPIFNIWTGRWIIILGVFEITKFIQYVKQYFHHDESDFTENIQNFRTWVWANSVDPDQTADQGCTRYSVVKPPCSNARVITTNFSAVHIFRIFTVNKESSKPNGGW